MDKNHHSPLWQISRTGLLNRLAFRAIYGEYAHSTPGHALYALGSGSESSVGLRAELCWCFRPLLWASALAALQGD